MYQPEQFRTSDSTLIRDLVREYPFATLVSGDGTEINHLPLLLRQDIHDRTILEGHSALGNPVAIPNSLVTAIFQGPHAYISPLWYVSPGQVPTWNYAVIHARGRLVPLEGGDATIAAMERLVHRFEGNSGWSMSGLPTRARDGLLAAIRYFQIEVTHLDVKVKLSQNRASADQTSVLGKLESSADPRHHEMATYFKRVNGATSHS
jgi:transcriptional regulator